VRVGGKRTPPTRTSPNRRGETRSVDCNVMRAREKIFQRVESSEQVWDTLGRPRFEEGTYWGKGSGFDKLGHW